MLTISVLCVDFMDGTPVADVPFTTTLRVTPLFPRFRHGQEPDENHLEPDTSLEVRFASVAAVADADGRAVLTFDADTAWAEVRSRRHAFENETFPPWDVVGYLDTTAELSTLDRVQTHTAVAAQHPGDSVVGLVLLDPGKIVIGHTTATTSRVLVETHGAPKPGVSISAVLRQSDGVVVDRRPVPVAGGPDDLTAVLEYDALEPRHEYALTVVAETAGGDVVLIRGTVRTLAATPERWTIDFASCHKPGGPHAMQAWSRAANREPADVMLLLGDQIYGDDAHGGSAEEWERSYTSTYHRYWAYQPLRRVVRQTPLLCMLDDHEVADDLGVISAEEMGVDRIAGALAAYRRFQDSLNPPGREPDVFDYSFGYGRLAGYMLDERTHRRNPGLLDQAVNDFGLPDPTVLGDDQLARLRVWAASPQARDADVIVIGSPVPFAFLPYQQLVDIGRGVVEGAAGVVGGLVGMAVAGPVGAAVVGYLAAEGVGASYDDHYQNGLEPDLQDGWVHRHNQAELDRVLDVVFDLANDVRDGVPGPRRRAVFVLAGDVHDGCMHLLRSSRSTAGHDHRGNRLAFQLTSSPISTAPTTQFPVAQLLSTVPSRVDLRAAEFLKADPSEVSYLGCSRFHLDPDRGERYAAEFLGAMTERNVGRLQVEHVRDRTYRFTSTIEGSTQGLSTVFELDLDAERVQPRDLLGTGGSDTGQVVYLRVHDRQVLFETGLGPKVYSEQGFGPAWDAIDGEVVIGLDTAPDRFFGFQLRPGDDENLQHGWLTVLRQAFLSGDPVTVEYVRTGPANGTVSRVMTHPHDGRI